MPPKAAKQGKAEVTEVDEAHIKPGPKMAWKEVQAENATLGRTNFFATFREGTLLLAGGWSGKVQSQVGAAGGARRDVATAGSLAPTPAPSMKPSPNAAAANTRSPLPTRTPLGAAADSGSHSATSQPMNPSGHLLEMSSYGVESHKWAQLPAAGNPHPGTSQAAVVEVEDEGHTKLLFFAGWNGTQRVNDVTQYDFDTSSWSPYPPPTAASDKPPALTFHTASYANKRCYLFGGNTLEGQSSEMHYLDLATRIWSHAASLGAPARRSSHSATVVNDTTVVIFGGRGGADGSQALNDVALFDTTNNHWMIGVKVEGAPPPRYGHTAVAVKNKVIVYGGVGDQGQLLSDCWILEMEKPNQLSWSRVQQEGQAPSPRAGHFALIDALGTTMFVVGGRTEAQSATAVNGVKTSSEIFELNLGAIAPVPTTAGSTMDDEQSEVTTTL